MNIDIDAITLESIDLVELYINEIEGSFNILEGTMEGVRKELIGPVLSYLLQDDGIDLKSKIKILENSFKNISKQEKDLAFKCIEEQDVYNWLDETVYIEEDLTKRSKTRIREEVRQITGLARAYFVKDLTDEKAKFSTFERHRLFRLAKRYVLNKDFALRFAHNLLHDKILLSTQYVNKISVSMGEFFNNSILTTIDNDTVLSEALNNKINKEKLNLQRNRGLIEDSHRDNKQEKKNEI